MAATAFPRLRAVSWQRASTGRSKTALLFDSALFAGVGVVALGVSLVATSRPLGQFVAIAAICLLSLWMLVNPRLERSLVVFALYLGLADGYVKLRLNTDLASLGRDALLVSMTAGALIRVWLARTRLVVPPLSGWILAFAVIVLAELANPENASWSHRLYALRPHLEFLPLFFFGYVCVRTERRLRGMAVLLLMIASANGVANLVQVNQTPEQLASWGPGYAAKIYGERTTTGSGQRSAGAVSARTFKDATGKSRVRPFGLGGDIGFGGLSAVLALPVGLALLMRERRPWRIALAIAAGALAVVAIVTAQARLGILEAIVAVLAFGALAAISRRGISALVTIAIAVGTTYLVVGALGGAGNHLFDRYSSIAPGQVITTTTTRVSVVKDLPDYLSRFPLGAGLGSAGPAKWYGGGPRNLGLSGESEFTFLAIEVGAIGLLTMLLFQVRVLALTLGVRRFRRESTRLLLAGLAAPLFAVATGWMVGAVSVSSPSAPYTYFLAGLLAWWVRRAAVL